MKVFIVLAAVCALAYGSRIRLSPPRLDGRIVGGKDTDIEDLPYQLSLQSYGSHICGASIISENWALTAAHCVDEFSASSVSVRAGSSTRGQSGSVHQAKRIIVNPKYDSWNIDFDYALIEVATPFSFGAGVQAIKLADNEPQGGADAITSGWGTTSSGAWDLPSNLKSVVLPIVARDECQRRYTNYDVTGNMVCAGVLDVGGKDTCQGDSGGPLASGGELVGVVSWGIGCADRDYPGVYSNVAAARPWIKENSGV